VLALLLSLLLSLITLLLLLKPALPSFPSHPQPRATTNPRQRHRWFSAIAAGSSILTSDILISARPVILPPLAPRGGLCLG
jgi:hypothetical protein